MDRLSDFRIKIDAIRSILKTKGFDGIEIKSQTNFSYVTRGRGFIGLASVMACASLFITNNRVVLVGENIDAQRIFDEQLLSNPDIDLMIFPWDEPDHRNVIVESFAKNLKIATEVDLEHELYEIRTRLSEYDMDAFRELGKEAATIIENICKQLKKGIREYELAGEISKQLWEKNIEPITLLVAFDGRGQKYRHPVMVENRLENYALVGICGRRNGLIVSLTRDVLLKHDAEIMDHHSKCIRVNASFWNKLKPGTSVSEVFAAGVAQYGIEGYPLEYKEHHQGGLTGFIPRELRASFESKHVIRSGEAYAFNPTLKSAKVEDTVLVTNNGLEILTYTGNYSYENCTIMGKNINVPTVFVIEGN
ncbi:MAG: M24 family metallopeptidase [Clostridia bacterium]|nr:M24 family metallopeptidase [Clostridia bacterium]